MENPLSGTPAVFVKAQDIINSYTVKDYTVCKAVAEKIGAPNLVGCQRIGKIWRVYPKTTESRVKLLTNKIDIGGQLVHVYGENPMRTGAKDPQQSITKITVKDLPLSKGNTALQTYLEGNNVKLTRRIEYSKARDPETHELSEWLNGDRICFAESFSQPLPRTAMVGDTVVRIFHDGQVTQNNKLCTRCFSTEHYRGRCPNPPSCNRCRLPGHQPGDPACRASLQEPQHDIVTIQGKDNILSNFYPCHINIFGIQAKSGEHAYQYSKAIRRGQIDLAKKIAESRTAGEAKFNSRLLKNDQKWKDEKEDVMRQVLQAKAQQVPEFREALIHTQNNTLVETVKNEMYWGSGLDAQDTLHTKPNCWMGKNRLGEIMSEIRSQLISEDKQMKKKKQRSHSDRSKSSSRHTRSNMQSREKKGRQRQDAASYMAEESEYDTGSGGESTAG